MHWYYSELLFSASFKDSKSGSSSWVVNIGEAASDRIIVVAAGDQAGTPISSVTIAGGAATRRIGNGHAQIWTRAVASGTTATVSVSSSSAVLNGIGVYSIYGLSSEVPAFTATGTTGVSLNVNAGGFAIASFSSNSSVTPVWTGATRDYFASLSGGEIVSSASVLSATTQTLAISQSSVAGSPTMVAASWGPV